MKTCDYQSCPNLAYARDRQTNLWYCLKHLKELFNAAFRVLEY